MFKIEEGDGLKEKAHEACKEFLGGAWAQVSLEELSIEPVHGGFSNKLFRCSLPDRFNISNGDKVPKEILMRIYGQIQSGPDDRLQGITVFTLLSEKRLGPKLHGLFSDGRLEEYIPSRTLKWDELTTYSLPIAEELGRVHALDLPIKRKPLLKTQTYEWLEFSIKNVHERAPNIIHEILRNGELKKEIDWVINEIEKKKCAIVFCHNDLQGNNILLLDSPKSDDRPLTLIDFEFGAFNYRAFDMANHFNTRCYNFGLNETDFSFYFYIYLDKYPTKSEQIEFVDAYLHQLQKEGVSFKNDFQTERNKILEEIPVVRLSVYLYWMTGFCKFDQASAYTIPVWDFALESWKIYQTLKEEYLKQDAQNNGEESKCE